MCLEKGGDFAPRAWWPAVGESLSRYMGANAGLCRVLLGDGGSGILVRRMIAAVPPDAPSQKPNHSALSEGEAIPV